MKSRWFGVERGLRQGFLFVSTSVKYLYNVNGGEIRMSSAWSYVRGPLVSSSYVCGWHWLVADSGDGVADSWRWFKHVRLGGGLSLTVRRARLCWLGRGKVERVGKLVRRQWKR